MSTSFDDAANSHESRARDALGEQFQELFDSVEDLLKRVADVQSPELEKIRAKARVALMMAKSALQDGASHVGRQARRAAGTTDEYLREYPWYALGAGTLLGFGLGMLVAHARD
jgi:ElaB protein